MSYAIGSRACGHLGCHRRVMTTANGRADGPVVYAFCDVHTALLQTTAFGSPRSPLTPAYTSVSVAVSAGRRALPAVDTSR